MSQKNAVRGLSMVPIEHVEATAFVFPTSSPESDGTFEWTQTTVVVVEAHAAGLCGIGSTYSSTAAAAVVRDMLVDVVKGKDAMAVPEAHEAMAHAIRNVGRSGIAMAAVSAMDVALWDLKARLLELPIVTMLGSARTTVPVYGSGGFTSYSIEELQRQLAGWIEQGIGSVKIKVGRDPIQDLVRVRAARKVVGADVALMVDANGAYRRQQARNQAVAFGDLGVTWFEEPVSSDDLSGLRLLCHKAPPGMAIAAGEYGSELFYFQRMLRAGAVDVLQADATRCGGITGFLRVAALCEAASMPLSAHTAPSLHGQLGCVLPGVESVEYFHDHALIEPLLFEGALVPHGGALRPDLSAPGLGLVLRRADAMKYAVTF